MAGPILNYIPAGSAALYNVDPNTGNQALAAGAPGDTTAQLVSEDGRKATYRYAKLGFTPVATPTAWLVIQGSATKTIRIKWMRFGGVATANGNMQIQAQRRNTAGTLGSAVLTAVTAAVHDNGGVYGGSTQVAAADPAATAVVSTVGTANYTTLGTAVGGLLVASRLFMPTTATGQPFPLVVDFCTRQDKAFILRGTSDFLTIEGAGSAVPAGGVIDFEIEMEEDLS